MIVSDAGPLIIFARIGRLALLHDIVKSLTVPPAVYAEIRVDGMAGAEELVRAEWLHRVAVADPDLLQALPSLTLHAGEREAIALAKEQAAQLLIDEIRGRRIATQLGIEVIGTLRLLHQAKRTEKIETVGPLILEMQSKGYRFDRTLIRRFLEQIGEI
jgi:predicted nucleic acid-binding protein